MNTEVLWLLAPDGLTNGAVYALLAIALVLVFAVTRVIFLQQGDFVALAGLTLAWLQMGRLPGTVWLLVGLAAACALADLGAGWRAGRLPAWRPFLGRYVAAPAAVVLLCGTLDLAGLPLLLQILLTLLIITPMGPLIYRLAYQPVAEASTLSLLIVSVAVHFVLVGLCLFFFGPEGLRIPAFSDRWVELGAVTVPAQSLWVIGVSVVLIAALYLFFGNTINGKSLRAAAFNREGAKLMGISPVGAGRLAFLLAAGIGAISGVLIAPLTTIYYDTGFLISLKGFVGAILGGLASYPLAALGAVSVGVIEALASFWASAFKEVVLFTLVIPVLIWLSLKPVQGDEGEDE